jgi:eukaryotic-like serine/threonine-protein kinase
LSALDIDTRSDIYALGVLLYELLTGLTPFDHGELVAGGLDEMRRIIREQEPKRPSTRLSALALPAQTTVAERRHSEPPQLIHLLRGDLDWIVMRCLEKDRKRRYETANSLADDIVRHLHNEPVAARPPSRLYRFRKLVQRNKVMVAAAAAVMLALVLGLTSSLWALAKERAARRQAHGAEQTARTAAGKSQEVAQFLKDMLQGVGPSVARGRDTAMLREILDKTAARVGKDLKTQPEVEAELKTTLGEVYQALGQYAQAEGMYREALRLRQGLWGNMNTNVADSLDRLGHELRLCRGEAVESESLLEQALMIRTNLLGPEHVLVATTLDHLGGVQLYLGRLSEAVDLYQRSLAMRRHLLGSDSIEVAETLTILADTVRYQGRVEEAEAHAREALAILSRLIPGETATLAVAAAQESLGGVLLETGQAEEALNLLRNVVTIRKDLLGSEHLDSASALYNLGRALRAAHRLAEAELMIREALAVCRRQVGRRHTLTAFCLEKLGDLGMEAGRPAEAEQAYRDALALWKTRENHQVRRVRAMVLVALRAQQKTAEAEALMAEAAAEARPAAEAAQDQPASEAAVLALLRWVDVLCCRGQAAEAEPWLSQALALSKGLPPSASLADELSIQMTRTAALQVWLGREAEHEAMCRRGLEWAADQPQWPPRTRASFAVHLRPLSDPQLRLRALALAQQTVAGAPTNSLLAWHQLALGIAEYRSGHYPEAERALSASELGGPSMGRTESRVGAAKFFRALILFRQGQRDAARQLLAETEAKMQPLPSAVHWALAEGADYDDLVLWLACKEARGLLSPQ